MKSFDLQSYKAVIFDLDGTLYDLAPLREKMTARLLLYCLKGPAAWRGVRALAEFRRVREQLAEEEHPGPRREQYHRTAKNCGLAPEQVERIVQDWILQRPLPYLAACVRPGVGEFFELLRARGIAVAVASDYPVEDKLDAMGLMASVSVCGPEGLNRLKPHPAVFLEVARLLDCAPGDCLVIGDRDERDGEAARRAGMDYLILQGGGASPENSFAGFGELCRGPESGGGDS